MKKILYKTTFFDRLSKLIEYIAEDSPQSARLFKNQMLNQIRKIPKHPYANRKSIYFNDENIRDLIFKGYTIVYRITEDNIEVFGFVKYQNTPFD